MKRSFLLVALFLLTVAFSRADEGMWLPSLIKERIPDMQMKGFRLTAEDLYSINQACLKDAIVQFGSGCTGELISDKGLILTNHHCGYSYIQAHSSLEEDYLKDGFWAGNLSEELPNPGLTVKFLVRMDDVTGIINNELSDTMSEAERNAAIAKISHTIASEAVKGTHYSAKVEAMYYGNQFFLFVYEIYKDIRLVGAPPSSIGKFGGDTDNWMWPRHTGDFSIFRIYAGPGNKPAAYSKDNLPYKPKKFFSISVNGVNEGDFTLVYGFPGRTQEYLHSEAIRYVSEVSNPHKINLRGLRLGVQQKEMSNDRTVRIQYSSKNANVANAWKKWQGEAKGIKSLNIVLKRADYEKRFEKWAEEYPQYRGITGKLGELYKQTESCSFANDYYNEAIISNEILKFAEQIKGVLSKKGDFFTKSNSIASMAEKYYKDYYMPIDKQSFILLMKEYLKNVPEKFHPNLPGELSLENSVENIADYLFKNSALADKQKLHNYIHDSLMIVKLNQDPAFLMHEAFFSFHRNNVKPMLDSLNKEITILYRSYMRGQMEFEREKAFYPDANLTLRITYGKVSGYRPLDAVKYKHLSTIEGIMEKDNPEIFDYDIPQRLRDLYSDWNFGRWESNGTIPVCFIATNHTSGGNSGSPVINADGDLVGINFDRVWEGTMSDIAFNPDLCRNISLDIRYVLFIIDKFAGAGHLIDEMEIVK
ncbi:MAG: S46 family peptidase [Bacteroidales bacterium]|nr:S46 family peptidase [Bacteroidales bacterium]MDD2425310.1 S46 family peptidase [Bacteroidales bacterium]MDD3989372.1 S46 family peptidase [Bacteroidales bacterium]MDD4638415.1 S46 family peptidase [Bacteroidales bacterium]